jgi:deazaflavin-dependent oxidoreductase (nitroreductase family)
MERTSPAEFNAHVVEEFRANGGRVGGALGHTPLLLLHHVGARSGIERVTPLAYLAQGDGRYAVIASDGGSPRHPAWYHNLKANPKATVEVGDKTFEAVAEELDAVARSELWPAIVTWAAVAHEYQSMTTRTIPVFILVRQG